MNEQRTTKNDERTASIDVLLLCGGLGSRLRPVVADRPKPMAVIDERPFLDILMGQFRRFGLRRFVLCTGHMSEAIEAHYAQRQGDIEVVISQETMPLGTAGAVKLAQPHILSDPFLVANGDSICDVDLAAFQRLHMARKAVMSMVVARCPDARDYGTVVTDDSQRIIGFAEKTSQGHSGLISAGIYLLGKEVLSMIPPGVKSSLECDLFPSLISRPCYAFMGTSPVLDIGTPDRLAKARQLLAVRH